MAKTEWGLKRTCQHCGARFYEPGASAAIAELEREGFPAERARCEVRVPVFRLPEPALDASPPASTPQ